MDTIKIFYVAQLDLKTRSYKWLGAKATTIRAQAEFIAEGLNNDPHKEEGTTFIVREHELYF